MDKPSAQDSALGHVVVVDDDPSVRKSLQTVLKREGYRVCAYDCADALLQAPIFYPPTVILSDMRMPGVSGVDFQAKLSALGHRWPMVFVSGESRHAEIIAAMKQGAADFLLKPFSAQEMLEAVERAMRTAKEQFALASKANHVGELLKRLTPRELEICHWMVRGYANQQIAAIDGAAAATIKLHRARVMEKMQANTLPELIEMLSDTALPWPAQDVSAREPRDPD